MLLGKGRVVTTNPHFSPSLYQPNPSETLAMEIEKLCRTREGNLFVLVSTDWFSKFVMASAMPDMTAESVAKVWLRDVLPFGAPAHVLTDQGCQFTSELMKVV